MKKATLSHWGAINTESAVAREAQRQLLLAFIAAVMCLSGAFLIYQLVLGRYWIVALHVGLLTLCALVARRVWVGRHFMRWATCFLVVVYISLTVLIEYPGASSKISFAWAYLMPVAGYLLLGQRRGFWVALPFMSIIAALGVYHMWPIDSHAKWLTVMDAVSIGALTFLFMYCYERARARDRAALERLAATDPLTGLANRRSFMAALRRTLDEAARESRDVGFAIMDIDHFKEVNDSYGHNAGDEVLRCIADKLTRSFRRTDTIGRLGGEEFGVILRGADQLASCKVLDGVREHFASTMIQCDDIQLSITVTSGMAYWPTDARSANQLYKIADERLYEGKRNGRNATVPSPFVLGGKALSFTTNASAPVVGTPREDASF